MLVWDQREELPAFSGEAEVILGCFGVAKDSLLIVEI